MNNLLRLTAWSVAVGLTGALALGCSESKRRGAPLSSTAAGSTTPAPVGSGSGANPNSGTLGAIPAAPASQGTGTGAFNNDLQAVWDRLRPTVVNLVTFGFRHGTPHAAELLFDLRFLPNPYFVEALRARFDRALAAARWDVTLDGDPAAPGRAVRDRNQWLWTAAVGAIVVGDTEVADQAEMAGLGVVVID